MDGMGHELLARAGLAEQQNRRIGRRDLLDAMHHVIERVAGAHDPVIGADGLDDRGNVGGRSHICDRRTLGHVYPCQQVAWLAGLSIALARVDGRGSITVNVDP